jgi:predicted enzyme related to lactoylglutathione lyase
MIGYFEIPVSDLDRAMAFYSAVLDVSFERTEIHGHPMALFPDVHQPGRVSGALASGHPYSPADAGVLVYLAVSSISAALERIEQLGGRCVFPKTSTGDFGYVAEFIDSEGNRIALMESLST